MIAIAVVIFSAHSIILGLVSKYMVAAGNNAWGNLVVSFIISSSMRI